MSEEMTQEKCEAAGGKWNTENNTCDMPPKEAAITVDTFNLQKAITESVKEYGQLIAADIKKDVLADVMKSVEDIKKQAADAVRTGLGIEKDPVIHLSQVSDLVRKAMLEEAGSQKRTPAPTQKGGPDGNKKPDPFEEKMKQKGLVTE